MLDQTVPIAQIALFTDPDASVRPLLEAAWSALEDVDRFFVEAAGDEGLLIPVAEGSSTARVRPVFERRFAGPASVLPPRGARGVELTEDFLAAMFARQIARGLSMATNPSDASSNVSSSSASGAPARPRTVDARLLGPAMQTLLEPEGWTLLVTDLELTPPPDWRYIIWDGLPLGAVASIAPLDPAYWHEPINSEEHRAEIVRHRTRAACMSIVGSLLGLERCRNEACFLFFNVDSIIRLDEMRLVGEEHDVRALSVHTFDAPPAPIVSEPAHSRERP